MDMRLGLLMHPTWGTRRSSGAYCEFNTSPLEPYQRPCGAQAGEPIAGRRYAKAELSPVSITA